MLTALNTGGRLGEILALVWGDIDTEHGEITFQGIQTKSAKTRRIPITDELAERLMHFAPDEDINDDDHVFPVKSVDKPWEQLMKMATLDINVHVLRRHVASTLALKGAALTDARSLLGHHGIEVTMRYLSIRKKDKFEALDLL